MYTVYTEESVFETIPLSVDDVFSLVPSLLARFGEEKFVEQTRGGKTRQEKAKGGGEAVVFREPRGPRRGAFVGRASS